MTFLGKPIFTAFAALIAIVGSIAAAQAGESYHLPGVSRTLGVDHPICQELRENRCKASPNELELGQVFLEQAHPKCLHDLKDRILDRLELEGIRLRSPRTVHRAKAGEPVVCPVSPSGVEEVSSLVSGLFEAVKSEKDVDTVRRIFDARKIRELQSSLYQCIVDQEHLHQETAMLSESSYRIQWVKKTGMPSSDVLVGEVGCIYRIAKDPQTKEDQYFIDKKSGFNAMKVEEIEPCPGRKARTLIVIAGTKNAKDWMGNLVMGRDQYLTGAPIVEHWAEEALRDNKELVITGHSLGGGLAQSLAFTTEMHLGQPGRMPNVRSSKDVERLHETLTSLQPQMEALIDRALSKNGSSVSAWSPDEKLEIQAPRGGQPGTLTVHHQGKSIVLPIDLPEAITITSYLDAKKSLENHLKAKRDSADLSVVTWNAFGGQELLVGMFSRVNTPSSWQNHGFKVSTNTLDQTHPANASMSSVRNTVNYYAGTDQVKSFGNHIGTARELRLPETGNVIKAHSLAEYVIPNLAENIDQMPLVQSNIHRTIESANSRATLSRLSVNTAGVATSLERFSWTVKNQGLTNALVKVLNGEL